jgi:EAL domain-containing protein (putative c-di-GMP-specific phosphodiesterase class I)
MQKPVKMIKQALQALTFWDKAGLNVPRIGVNFSTSELRNSACGSHRNALGCQQYRTHRLVIEVLETVIADGADDDIIGKSCGAMDLGCGS